MSPFWSWLSKRKKEDRRIQKSKHNQPGHRRQQADNRSRNTGAATWGEQTWQPMGRSLVTTGPSQYPTTGPSQYPSQYPTTGSSQYPTTGSSQYPTTGSSQYPTTGPSRHHNTSRTADVFGAGLTHEAGSATRQNNQWIIRDRQIGATLPGTNRLHLSDKHSGNTNTSIHPPEAVLLKDYPSSYHHLIPSTSNTERGHYTPAAQTDHQLVALQQPYSPGFRAPPTFSPDHPTMDHPQPQPLPSLDQGNGIRYLQREGQNKGPADHHMLLHAIPRQDAPRYDLSHPRYESQTTKRELAVATKQEINDRRISESQTRHNTSTNQQAKTQFLQPSAKYGERFGGKPNGKVTAQEYTHVFAKGHVQKLYPWPEMYEMRRTEERPNRIVYNYIPKALGQQDLSGLLCGGNIDQLSSATSTDFKAHLPNDRARYQQQMRDPVQRYPEVDIQEPPQPDLSHGSRTPDYIHRYPLVQEPPLTDYNRGSKTPDYIHRYPLTHEQPVPDYTDGSTTPDHTHKLWPGPVNTPQSDGDHTRQTPSRTHTPQENVTLNRLSVQHAHSPGRETPRTGHETPRTGHETPRTGHETPRTGDTDQSSNSNEWHVYSHTSTNRQKPPEATELLKLRGRLSGSSNTPYVDTKSHSYDDAGYDNTNVDITSSYNGSFSPSSGRINTRFERNSTMASHTPLGDFNDDDDDDVNCALNQLDDATISESERDLIRELECIFQTQEEVLY